MTAIAGALALLVLAGLFGALARPGSRAAARLNAVFVARNAVLFVIYLAHILVAVLVSLLWTSLRARWLP